MNNLGLMAAYLMGKMRRVYFMSLPESKEDFKKSRVCYTIGDTAAQIITQLAGGTFIVLLMDSVNISDGNIGIITSIVSLAAIFQLFTMNYTKQLGKYKLFVCISVLQKLWFAFIFFIPIFPWGDSWKRLIIVLAFFFAHICVQIGMPTTIDWIASLVPSRLKGRYFSIKDSIAVFVVVTIMLVMGIVIDFTRKDNLQVGFIILGISIALLSIVNVIAFSFMKEPKLSLLDEQGKEIHGRLAKKKSSKQLEQKKHLFSEIKEAFQSTRFNKALFLNCIWLTSFFIASPFNSSYQLKELKLSFSYIMLVGFIVSLMRVFITPKVGAKADKIGMAKVLKFTVIAMGLNYFVMIFAVPTNAYVTVALAAFFSAIGWSFIGIGMLGIQLEFLDRNKRMVQFTILSAISGVYGFIVSFIGGKLIDFLQKQNLNIAGIHIYAQQITNLLGLLFIVVMVIYLTYGIQNVKVEVNRNDGKL